MYFKALTKGLVNIPNIPIKFRNKIRSLNKNLGSRKFYTKLLKLDPLVKNQINIHDTHRAIRAYEVKLYTKKSIYEWFKMTKSDFEDNDFYKIHIDFPRDRLIKRISERAIMMFKKGAIKEVKKFIKVKVPNAKPANKAIGISEISDYLNEKLQKAQVIEKISIKTRQYAKRQATWARGNMVDWKKIGPNDLNKFLKKIYISRT